MDKRTPPPASGTDNTTAAGPSEADKAESPVAKPAARTPRARTASAARVAAPRKASAGDVAPAHTPSAMEAYDIADSINAAVEQKKVALRDIIAQATVADAASLAKTLEAIMTGSSPDDAQE
ncbi:MAG TPA: polyphosphate kinase 2, partial [Accumulibacter sp.]|nr:polyphosphate kinase 2 [Accumulibacter sp.]